jgi:hypothetical protein
MSRPRDIQIQRSDPVAPEVEAQFRTAAVAKGYADVGVLSGSEKDLDSSQLVKWFFLFAYDAAGGSTLLGRRRSVDELLQLLA